MKTKITPNKSQQINIPRGNLPLNLHVEVNCLTLEEPKHLFLKVFSQTRCVFGLGIKIVQIKSCKLL